MLVEQLPEQGNAHLAGAILCVGLLLALAFQQYLIWRRIRLVRAENARLEAEIKARAKLLVEWDQRCAQARDNLKKGGLWDSLPDELKARLG